MALTYLNYEAIGTASSQGIGFDSVGVDQYVGLSKITLGDIGADDGPVSALNPMPVDSELPAAAALADNTANPTVPAIGSFSHLWDGALWDRAPGDSVNGQLVNLGANNDMTLATLPDTAAGDLAAIRSALAGTLAVNTELPTAAALTDNMANPTAPAVAAHGMLWDSLNWDRAPGDSISGAWVNIKGDAVGLLQYSQWASRFDPAGGDYVVGTDGLAAPSSGIQIGGIHYDGSLEWRPIHVDTAGNIHADIISSALPTGAATEATLSSALTALQLIDNPVATISATPVFRVAIFDNLDTQVTSFGGGTQYTEDAAAPADPQGNAQMLVRKDSPAALTSLDGDWVARRGTDYGAAYTQIVDSSGNFVNTFGGGTQYTEGDTDISITGTAMMVEDAANTLRPAQGDIANGLDVDVTRVQGTVTVAGTQIDIDNLDKSDDSVSIWANTAKDGIGTAYIPVVDTDGHLQVDVLNTVTVTGTITADNQELPSAAALADSTANPTTTLIGAMGHVWNGASWDRLPGTSANGVQVNTELNTAGTLGDNESSPTTASIYSFGMVWDGALWDRLPGNSTDGATVNLGTNNDVVAAGDVAHDSVDSGNSLKIGAKATTSLSGITLVANADRTNLFAGVDGVQIVRNHCNLEDAVQDRATNTDGVSTAFGGGLAAPGVGIRLWVTKITVSNSSATPITVDIRDGAAGSVVWTIPCPANGGAIENFDPPLKFTANTAVAYDGSAAVTTLTISGKGFKSKV